MAKKNKVVKNEIQADAASDELRAELLESASAESEAPASDIKTDVATDVSLDDVLDDVRRSLIEEDADDAKNASWWNRGKNKHKEQDDAVVPSSYVIEKPKEEDPYLEQIDELIDLLEPEPETAKVEAIAEPEIVQVVEPEVILDVDELKKRAFSSTAEAGQEREMSEMRAIALEGGEEVFVEVEARTADPFDERWKAFENSLRPYKSYIYYAVALLGVVLAMAAGVLLVREYQKSRPPEPAREVSNLPYPTGLALPGEINFNLGRGVITDGQWNPSGPEWLEGTEICRWVAIPWNPQREAVVRTLNRKDTIGLTMSNNDKFTYNVDSIQEMTLAEMLELDSSSPCLLLVLAKQDSDKRLVITALP